MEERFGEHVTIELKPGGEDIAVTEANKKEYVDLVVEYRISKRVKEQFDAFMEGLLELVPSDLINVFDERELELLIGGMSEIDMYDSTNTLALHTILTLILIGMTGPSSQTIADTKRPIRLSNGSGSAYAHGLPSASRVCYNSQPVLRVSLSMVSRICRALTDLDGSQSRNQAILTACQEVIHALIAWISRHIRIMRVWRPNSYLLSSTPSLLNTTR